MQHCTATMSICFLMTRRRRCKERPHRAAVGSSVKFNFRRPVSCTRASVWSRTTIVKPTTDYEQRFSRTKQRSAHFHSHGNELGNETSGVFFFALCCRLCSRRLEIEIYTTWSMEKRSLESSETWRNTRNCSRLKSFFFPLLHAYEGSLLCSRCVLFFFSSSYFCLSWESRAVSLVRHERTTTTKTSSCIGA